MIEEAAHTPLAAWESFYVIVGSSGAALTGLQFVVMALIAESPIRGSSTREIDAFGTPVIVHFSAVLLIAAILSSPWQGLSNVSIALGVCGLVGMFYGVIVVRRAKRQTGYVPVWEDWLWHAVLPLSAYIALFVSALLLRSYAQRVLFIIGGVSLLLLFIGIHNSWDTVTYIALTTKAKRAKSDEHSQPGDDVHQETHSDNVKAQRAKGKGRRR
jgi:hypothetical protein